MPILDEINFSFRQLPSIAHPQRVVVCPSDFFQVVDAKNVHMHNWQGSTNRQLARQQWEQLVAVYHKLVERGVLEDVIVLQPGKGLEDMVFTANQSFAWESENGNKLAILSNMVHESRRKEVPHFEKMYREMGYAIHCLKTSAHLEGCGDMILHPSKRLIFGGHGFRSSLETYDEIAPLLDAPIVPLQLVDPRFYQLDTCFLPISDETVLLFPGAFHPDSLALIEKVFPNVVAIPLHEAEDNFALNAHCIHAPNSQVAIIQNGSPVTVEHLKVEGFEVTELDTSEFMKSGGSVFCMKMMAW